jgi:AcrR family transcriptional regulator
VHQSSTHDTTLPSISGSAVQRAAGSAQRDEELCTDCNIAYRASVPTLGLRERKRRDTRRALATAAQELVLELGLDEVSVDQIAASADVSPRTFFNHFSSKDEAVVGIDDTAVAELADELRLRPRHEGPRTALRAVLVADADAASLLRHWRVRNELVRRYPVLLPRYLEAGVKVEEELAGALAERIGVDPSTDPYPRLLTATALAVMRTTLTWWSNHGEGDDQLLDALDRALEVVVPDRVRR